ncbi:hypothetical protein BSU04nite_20890 [Bacillus spizizenii]|nr:hypothetical protein BSU04nite_20890 [Bacillus spizizenii]
MAFHYNIFLKNVDIIYKSLNDIGSLLDQLSIILKQAKGSVSDVLIYAYSDLYFSLNRKFFRKMVLLECALGGIILNICK